MKKITASILSLSLVMGGATSVLGETLPESEVLAEKPVVKESVQKTYDYVYDGVEFVSQSPLNSDELEQLSKMSANPLGLLKPEISPLVIPSEGYTGIMENGPHYQHHKNLTSRLVVTAVGWWVAEKFKVSSKVSAAITAGVFVASETFLADTYVGTWQYKAWNQRVGMYEHFITLVHYTNNSYDQPKKVYNYSQGYW